MEVIQSVKFKYEPSERVGRLLKDYLDMVNFCIRKAVEARSTLKRLHHLAYQELKGRYDYNTQYFVTAYRTALSIVKSWKNTRANASPLLSGRSSNYPSSFLGLAKRFAQDFDKTKGVQSRCQQEAMIAGWWIRAEGM